MRPISNLPEIIAREGRERCTSGVVVLDARRFYHGEMFTQSSDLKHRHHCAAGRSRKQLGKLVFARIYRKGVAVLYSDDWPRSRRTYRSCALIPSIALAP